MAKGAKFRHDARAVFLHIEAAKLWGKFVGLGECRGDTFASVAVQFPVVHRGALDAESFLTPGAYAMAFAKGYHECAPAPIRSARRG